MRVNLIGFLLDVGKWDVPETAMIRFIVGGGSPDPPSLEEPLDGRILGLVEGMP